MSTEIDSKWANLKQHILSNAVTNYKENQPIIIFCAGDRGLHARFTLRDLGYKIIAFCDNSPLKQGTIFHGLKVLGPKEVQLHKEAFVVVAIETLETQKIIQAQLQDLGVPASSIGAFVYPPLMARIDSVYQSMLADEKSKNVLYHYLMAHFEQNGRHFRSICEDRQYFCLDFLKRRSADGEVFIDAGAYNGDTLEAFVNETNGVFERIVSFEPTADLYIRLKERAASLSSRWSIPESKLSIVFGGVGEFDCLMPLVMKDTDPNGAGNSFYDIAERTGDLVPIYSIDSYLNGSKVTFIKADIEGFELNMLKGAKSTIISHKPDLSICMYHKASDIYEIPEYIKSLVPEYKLYLRHHLYDYSETVLYCSIL
jgi:FkbM family methyltransferase